MNEQGSVIIGIDGDSSQFAEELKQAAANTKKTMESVNGSVAESCRKQSDAAAKACRQANDAIRTTAEKTAQGVSESWKETAGALQSLTAQSKIMQKELSQINQSLKLNPDSVVLQRQKVELLNKTYAATVERLKALEAAQEQAGRALSEGQLDEAGYRKFQRELESARLEVQLLDQALGNTASKQTAKTALQEVSKAGEQTGNAMKQAAEDTQKSWTGSVSILQSTVKALSALVSVTMLKNLAASILEVGSQFEASMSKVSAVSGAAGQELEGLAVKAKELGASTMFSASETAEALNYMGMAGWDAEQMLSGISGVLDLAAASGENLGLVSDIVTDALTAFGLAAEDSGRFADVLASAASSANTTVGRMGQTFQYAAPLAGAMGYAIEDVAVAIGLMANAGIKGEQAGTNLRAMFSRLASPPKDAAAAMKRLGLEITDAGGAMKPLSVTLNELRSGFAGLSEQEKTSAAAALAGTEAMSGLLAIVNAGEEDFNRLTESIASADGAASQMAATMRDNLQGDVTAMKSALEGLGVALYEEASGGLRNMVSNLTEGIRWLTDHTEDLGRTLGIVAAGLGVYTASAIQAKLATIEWTKAFAANPVGLIAVGVTAAAVALVSLADALHVTASEQKKLAENAVRDWQEVQGQVKNVNGELKNIQKQIDALNAKKAPSVSDKAELERLQNINRELEIQADLLEKQEQRAARKAAEETVKAFDKMFHDADTSMEAIEQRIEQAKGVVLVNGGFGPSYDVTGFLAQLKQLPPLIEAAQKAGNAETAASYAKTLDEAKAALESYLQTLQEYQKTLSAIPKDLMTEEQKTAFETTGNLITEIYRQLDPEKLRSIEFSELLQTKGLSETVKQLTELAVQGEITAKTLNDPQYAKFRETLEQAGFSAEETASEINGLAEKAKAAGASAGNLNDSLNGLNGGLDETEEEAASLAEQISGLSEGFELLSKAQEEAAAGNRLSASTLKALADRYPEMEDALARYAAGMLQEQELLAELTGYYETDQRNYRLAVLAKLETSEAFYRQSGLNDAAFVNAMLDNYGVDISNCKTYAETKARIEETLLNNVSSAWSKYYNAQSRQVTAEYGRLKMTAEVGRGPKAEEAKKELAEINAAIQQYQQAMAEIDAITLDGISVDFEKIEKNTSAALSKTAETAKEAGKDYSEELAKGISSEAFRIDDSIASLCEAAANTALDNADSFEAAGSLYIDAFTDGIGGKVEASIQAVQNFADLQAEALAAADQDNAKVCKQTGGALVEAYSAQLKENAAQAAEQVKASLEEMTQTAQREYDRLIQQRDALAAKWTDTGSLFTLETDKETGTVSVLYQDLEEQAKALEAYYDQLEALKAKGLSDGILDEITSMNTADALKVLEDLSQKSSSELTEFSRNFEEIQQRAAERAAAYYQSEIEQLNEQFTEQFTAALESIPALVRDIGLNTAGGFLEGVQARMGEVSGKGKEMSEAVLAAMKKALDIHSPSGETKRVGEYLAEGMWQGIDGREGWLKQRINGFCRAVIAEFQSAMQIHSPSKVMADQVGVHLSEGLAKGMEDGALTAVYPAVRRVTKGVLSRWGGFEELMAGTGKSAGEALSRTLGDEAWYARQEMEKFLEDRSASILEQNAQTVGSLEHDLIRQTARMSSQYQRLLHGELQKIGAEAGKLLDGVTEQAKAKYEEITQLASRVESNLKNFGDLYIQYEGEFRLNNLDEVSRQMDEYAAMLDQLSQKGASMDFLNQIAGMGVEDGLKFAQALQNASDAELQAYLAQWEANQRKAEEISSRYFTVQTDKLKDEFNTQVNDVMQELSSQVAQAGKNASQGFVDGLLSNLEQAEDAAKQLSNAVVQAFQKSLDIHSPSRVMRDRIGKNMALGLEEGVLEETGRIEKNVTAQMRAMTARMQAAVAAESRRSAPISAFPLNAGNTGPAGLDRPISITQNNYSPKALSRREQRQSDARLHALALHMRA